MNQLPPSGGQCAGVPAVCRASQARQQTGALQAIASLLYLFLLPAVFAQQNQRDPHIGYLYPAGGQVGTTFQVVIGGQGLSGVSNAVVTGPGARATLSKYTPPLSPRDVNTYREKAEEIRKQIQEERQQNGPGKGGGGLARFRELAHQKGITDEILLQLAEMRQQRADPKRQLNPQLAEVVILNVTIAAEAPVGERELRLVTAGGLSNPLVFQVGQCKEFTEEQPRPSIGWGWFGRQAEELKKETDLRVTLPAVVNGQILPGDTDKVRFAAKKGDRLVIAVAARALIPYLADAVPGWFQATITLLDAQGKEVAYADDFRFSPDPVLYYEVLADGEYTVEIKDAIYRGREDFVYRITMGELPFVTSVYPLGGPANGATTVELRGWNLATATLTLDCRGRPTGINPISVRRGQPVPFSIDELPEEFEKEPNDSAAKSQPADWPRIINGRIAAPGDWDVFRFEGKAGQEIVAEIFARRLNSPLDSVLKITDAAGKQLAFNDDTEDKGAGLTTHHADSRLALKLPAAGTYFLYVGDTQRGGSPAHAYRLRLSQPQPDFALRVAPASLNARPGMSVPLTVFALRKDGFTNAITVELTKAPTGFKLAGGIVPAGQDSAKLTITVPRTALKEPVKLELEGRATINGQEIVRPAVPAEDMTQAFAYHHLVPAQELLAAVTPRPAPRANIQVLTPTPIRIPLGGTAKVKISIPREALANKLDLVLDPVPGITLQTINPDPEGRELVIAADRQAKQGQKGNLILNAFVHRAPPAEKDKPAGPLRRVPLGVLPAIAYEVTGPVAAPGR